MTIATIDIGGTGIKFASLTPDGKILDKTSIPTPESLEDLLAWLDQRLSEQDYSGIAMSVPGAVNQETGVIDGFSAVPYIHGFSWYEALAHHQLPVHLENDANCVGLSELLAHSELENAACVVIGTGIGGAMIINGRLHRGRHGLGGEFGYMTTLAPAKRLNNWSQLASTGNMVRYVIEKSGQTDWDGRRIYQEAAAGNTLCQEAIERMNRNLAQGLLNIQYLIDPDVINLGGLSVKTQTSFKVSRRLSMTLLKPTKNTRSYQLSKPVPIMQMPISTVLLSTGYRRKTNGNFYRT